MCEYIHVILRADEPFSIVPTHPSWRLEVKNGTLWWNEGKLNTALRAFRRAVTYIRRLRDSRFQNRLWNGLGHSLMYVRWRMIKISYVKGVLYETIVIKDLGGSTNSHIGLWGCIFYTRTCSLSLSLSLTHTHTHTQSSEQKKEPLAMFTVRGAFHETKNAAWS